MRIHYNSGIQNYRKTMRVFKRHMANIGLIILFFICALVYHRNHSCLSIRPSGHSVSNTTRIMYIVRTISKNYRSRLYYLLQTWIPLIHEHVFFISDRPIQQVSQTHVIYTEKTCGLTSHSVRSLCCQTGHDFILYRREASHYDWLCHFDDDQYVHVDNLREYLSTLDPQLPYYIGRNSWLRMFKRNKKPYPYDFWFATLGAGVCLSKKTIHLLENYTQTVEKFADGCVREFYPDDIYIGFLISNYLNVSLTMNHRFHSHLERSLYNDTALLVQTFHQQITFGFPLSRAITKSLPHLFPRSKDPTGMLTLHCLLNSQLENCRITIQNYLFTKPK